MDLLDASAINMNDICLFECKVQRYDTGPKNWRHGWTSTFHLLSLTKIIDAPASAEEVVESEDEAEAQVSTDDELEGF